MKLRGRSDRPQGQGPHSPSSCLPVLRGCGHSEGLPTAAEEVRVQTQWSRWWVTSCLLSGFLLQGWGLARRGRCGLDFLEKGDPATWGRGTHIQSLSNTQSTADTTHVRDTTDTVQLTHKTDTHRPSSHTVALENSGTRHRHTARALQAQCTHPHLQAQRTPWHAADL